LKKFKYAILDMDGTILDSMPAWRNLGWDYLLGKGIKPSENLNEIISSMSMIESASYFREEYGLKESIELIITEVNQLIDKKYRYEMQLKPFAREYLIKLRCEDVTMCLATATPVILAEAALKRLDILKYFSYVVCCDEVGAGKSKPDVFHYALKKMKADIMDTVVFEDADYAMKTAKAAGFYTVGVFDESAAKPKEEMQLLCDEYIESFESLLK